MLKMAGIIPRKRIAEILDRGNARVVKERMMKLNVSSRNINGMNIAVFRKTFGQEPRRSFRTLAGPSGANGASFYTLVLWVDIEKWIDRGDLPTTNVLTKLVKTYALMQRWLHGKYPARSINKILKENI
jgi:hypothetical protein